MDETTIALIVSIVGGVWTAYQEWRHRKNAKQERQRQTVPGVVKAFRPDRKGSTGGHVEFRLLNAIAAWAILFILLASCAASQKSSPCPVESAPLPAPWYCFAGMAPQGSMVCSETLNQCERDRATAAQAVEWQAISTCKLADVYVEIRGEARAGPDEEGEL